MPKYDLSLAIPLMNAAGSLGFAFDPHGPVDLPRLGAFVTNPVSLGPRTPARGRRFISYRGGFILHTGYPNPGLKAVIRRYAGRWARSPLPVLVHLLAQNPEEISAMIRRLEGMEGVVAVEIGLPPDIDRKSVARFAQASEGELPAVLRLPLDRAAELTGEIAFGKPGIAALSLGPPRGALPAPVPAPFLDDANRQGREKIHGRLYGPAIFPLALEAVCKLVESGIPVIGAGGVYQPEDVEAMLAAGAAAVQLDSVLWRGNYGAQFTS